MAEEDLVGAAWSSAKTSYQNTTAVARVVGQTAAG